MQWLYYSKRRQNKTIHSKSLVLRKGNIRLYLEEELSSEEIFDYGEYFNISTSKKKKRREKKKKRKVEGGNGNSGRRA